MISKSIKYKFILVVFIICFICLSLLSIVSYKISYRAVLEQTTLKIIQTTDRNAEIMNNWFKQQSSIIQGIIEDFETLGLGDYKKTAAYLPHKKAHYPHLTLLYIAYPDKTLIADDWTPPEGFDPTGRVWYKGAVEAEGTYYSDPYLDANTGEMVIAIAQAYRQNGKVTAVVAADIDIGYVTELVAEIVVNEKSYAFLLDNHGNIVAHPNKEFQPTSERLTNINDVFDGSLNGIVQKISGSGADRTFNLLDYDGEEKVFTFSRISANGWVLGVVVPHKIYAEPLAGLFPSFATALLISIILGMGVILLMVNRMLKPVMSLTYAVKQFGDKKMDVRCSVSSQDEFGELSSSFNQMASMIQEYSITLEDKVEKRTKELVEKNAKIQDSIEYAKILQETILPKNEEMNQIFKDYFVIWDPKDTVGGDFYWMRRFDDGFIVLVGDCTGHGVPGALMTMAVNSLLEHIVDEETYKDPAALLVELNLRLSQSLRHGREGTMINDGLEVGMIYVGHDGGIVFAGAQISLYIVKEKDIIELRGSRDAIGCDTKKRPKKFFNQQTRYEPGMAFYMFTDGFKDQVGGDDHLPFGKKRLIALLKSVQNLTMEEQRNIFLSTYEEYLSGEPRRDDITILGFRI
ncbi:MAG: SpoIIE family protein phosphatase [Syntrophomonadaceae bacterium]|nr:SpoIIE family protein phosphatase [Syntrophomonadaceae bacterium]